ncbi:MAG: molybdenum cofactor biosynthesis protein MoaE, partial [Planctomycetota bacterium]
DELALIPPVSGGHDLFEVRNEPLEVAEVEAAVRHGGAGAVVSFTGTVRNNTKGVAVDALEYEAYRSMAEKYLRTIGHEIAERWPDTRVAMLHRVGRLAVGEASVVIAVSSPHRADAFDACRHSIERLKEDVPIWKKEFRTDGSVWVGVGS